MLSKQRSAFVSTLRVVGALQLLHSSLFCDVAEAKECTWEFSDAEAVKGWELSGLESRGVEKGTWRLLATRGTPQIFTPKIEVDAANQPVVAFRMRLGKGLASGGCLLFVTDEDPKWDDKTIVSFACIGDGEFHDYEVDVSKNVHWKGTVRQLRFQPIYVRWPIPEEQRVIEVDSFRIPDFGQSPQSSTELIGNGGFEVIEANGYPAGWKKFRDDPLPIDVAELRKAGNPANSLISDDAHTGKHSAWVSIPKGKQEIGGWAIRVPMKPRTLYRLSCWAKKSGKAGAGVAINEFRADGSRTAQQTPLVTSDQWKEYTVEFESHPETVGVQIVGYIWYSSGQAWFDDFSLRELSLTEVPASKAALDQTPFTQLTSQVVTPHIPWGRPWAQGAIKVLAMPRHREIVELAQRLSLDYSAWSKFESSDRTPGSEVMDRIYYNPPERSLSASLLELKRLLTRPLDVILIGSTNWPGWSVFDLRSLPKQLQEDLLNKVKNGAGVIFVRQSKDSPLAPFMEKPVDLPASVLAGVPFDGLPVLAQDVKGTEWLKCFTCGKGRVAIVDFQNEQFGSFESERSFRRGVACPFTPDISYGPRAKALHYDYYQSLLAKLVLWVGQKEGSVTLARLRVEGDRLSAAISNSGKPEQVVAEVVVRDAEGKVETTLKTPWQVAAGESEFGQTITGLKSAAHFADLWLKQDGKTLQWGSAYFETKAEVEVVAVETDKPSYPPGATIEGKVRLSKALPDTARVRIELSDSLGRVLERKELQGGGGAEMPFRLMLAEPAAIYHTVTASLVEQKRILSEKSAPILCRLVPRALDDFQFWFWANVANHDISSRYMIGDLYQRGFDVAYPSKPQFVSQEPQLTSFLTNYAKANLDIALYITGELVVSGGGYNSTDTVRPRCLTAKPFRESLLYMLQHQASVARDFPMQAYSLGDENGIACSGQDFCFSPSCQEYVRNYLKSIYGDLGKLNAEWGTQFASWEQVKAMTLAEARQHGNFAPWADLRMAMEDMFANLYGDCAAAIQSKDPGARVGSEGPTSNFMYRDNGEDSFMGYDFGKLIPRGRMWGVYFQHYPQIEFLRSFAAPDTVLFTFTQPFEDYPNGYYEDTWQNEKVNRFVPWYDLFHGMNAVQYWDAMDTKWYGFYSHDLRPTPWGQQITETMREIKGGVGKLLMQCRRENYGIAIHYSPASLHAQIALGGRERIESPRAFCHLLEDLGLQYDFISKEHMAQGKLASYRVLILPYSRAVSEKEAEAIRAFTARGGLVLADGDAGTMDAHCKAMARNVLEGVKLCKTGNPIWKYREVRNAEAGRRYRQEVATLLDQAGVRAKYRVVLKDETGAVGCEVFDFANGEARYLGLLRGREYLSKATENHTPDPVTVRLPGAYHVYSIREGRYLGQQKVIETTLEPAVARLFALFPWKVEAVGVAKIRREYRCGEKVECEISVRTSPAVKAPHVFRLEVLSPKGKAYREYSRNVYCAEGKGTASFRLALNDPAGSWRVVVRDVATGVRVERGFLVKP